MASDSAKAFLHGGLSDVTIDVTSPAQMFKPKILPVGIEVLPNISNIKKKKHQTISNHIKPPSPGKCRNDLNNSKHRQDGVKTPAGDAPNGGAPAAGSLTWTKLAILSLRERDSYLQLQQQQQQPITTTTTTNQPTNQQQPRRRQQQQQE